MHSVAITVDVDWAPDWAMRDLLGVLLEAGVPSTWFATHDTPVLDELRSHPDLIELGVHPNFLSGSSHGSDPHEVLQTCMALVPEARAMRTHCLLQSTPILQTVVDTTQLTIDTSLYVRGATSVSPSTLPLDHGRSLTRYPYVWEDDLEFFAEEPRWDADRFLSDRRRPDEITIVDVHPIHFALNSDDVRPYQALKTATAGMRTVTEQDAVPFHNRGTGARTFIEMLVESSRGGKDKFLTISALHSVRGGLEIKESTTR